jgi:diacylglycerol kinase family enzyme
MSVGSKYISGKLAYYMHVIPLVFTYKEPQITITIDGKKYIENILMLTVANGKYFGGGFILTPHANFNDNLFDVLTIKKVSLLKRIFNLSKIEKGKHLHLPFVKYNQTSDEILIHSDTELPAHIDGEFYRNKNFKIKFIENTITFKC